MQNLDSAAEEMSELWSVLWYDCHFVFGKPFVFQNGYLVYQSTPECVLGCIKMYQSVLKCTSVYKGVLSSSKVYQSVHGYTKVYHSILGCTQVYQKVPGCKKVYQSELEYTNVY